MSTTRTVTGTIVDPDFGKYLAVKDEHANIAWPYTGTLPLGTRVTFDAPTTLAGCMQDRFCANRAVPVEA